MSNDVNLGNAYVSGYFYHAPADTALPASPLASLASTDWEEVGYVSEAGIVWHHGRSAEPLKDWANVIRRLLQTDTSGTVKVPVISTTGEVLGTIFGADNVEADAATTAHGALTSVTVKQGTMSDAEAFLFIMQDQDDSFMLGTKRGWITALDDVTFAPNAPITWNATITANEWKFVKDDGQVTT